MGDHNFPKNKQSCFETNGQSNAFAHSKEASSSSKGNQNARNANQRREDEVCVRLNTENKATRVECKCIQTRSTSQAKFQPTAPRKMSCAFEMQKQDKRSSDQKEKLNANAFKRGDCFAPLTTESKTKFRPKKKS